MPKTSMLLSCAVVICLVGARAHAAIIHDAAAQGDATKVKILIEKDPELVDGRDMDGCTPLHWAADKGHKAVAQVLLANNADVSARKKDGVTPLHVAAALGRSEIVELLLADGADVNAKDDIGRTPLFCARDRGQSAVAELLADRGGEPSLKSSRVGRSPTTERTSAGLKAVRYMKATVRGCPVNMVFINLDDPRVCVRPGIALGGVGESESFSSFVDRFGPTAAINGSFFCKSSLRPIGDIVIGGYLAHFGGMGTALCITGTNEVDFVAVSRGRHMDWGKYKTVVSCGPRLVREGRVELTPRAEGFRDPHVLGTALRTAVGLTNRNRLLLLNTRKACSLARLAHIMKDLGCIDAINFDGGASVAMYYRGKMISTPGRELANVLLIYD